VRVQRLIVSGLERLCTITHPITNHRPWLWFFSHCPLVLLSLRLEDRWGTGEWVAPENEETSA
jgi:hypothetical protein